ncbi:unnamed protein product [Lepeophtheirus salmonis]|uniref:(salmon louse) hypothetical protein n=1 Tax=Lepeophtheirus salmonis TaxID=72036 RepID=A0A7R8D6P2_LEPSM|nr:unnamed protein product [Lepeophtheirus salmonis]CAF2992899.1 unnamed protein product [Lepeophtheirus salmonis]
MDTEERSNFNNSLSDYQRLERVDKNDEETSFHLVQLASTSRPVIIIYPTIAPETVIIPIVVSIIVFPIFVVSAIFLLRYYNQRARAKDKFRSGMQSGAAAIFSLSKISATNKPSSNRRNQYRDGFLGMPELGLGTLMEEKEFSGGTSDETCQKSSISPNTTTVLNEDDSNINNFESKSIPLKNFTQIVINGTSSNVVIASLEDLTTQKEDPDEIKVVSCAYSKKTCISNQSQGFGNCLIYMIGIVLSV